MPEFSSQIPSPAYTQVSMETDYMHKSQFEKMFSFMETVNNQFLQIRQHQASTINTLDVLMNDMHGLREEVSKIKTEKASGGRGGRGRGRGRGSRGRR